MHTQLLFLKANLKQHTSFRKDGCCDTAEKALTEVVKNLSRIVLELLSPAEQVCQSLSQAAPTLSVQALHELQQTFMSQQKPFCELLVPGISKSSSSLTKPFARLRAYYLKSIKRLEQSTSSSDSTNDQYRVKFLSGAGLQISWHRALSVASESAKSVSPLFSNSNFRSVLQSIQMSSTISVADA